MLTLAIACAMTACTGMSRDDVRPVAVARSLKLTAPVTVHNTRGMGNPPYTLAPDTYRAIGETERGVLYQCSFRCVSSHAMGSDYFWRGGVVIPADATQPAVIFIEPKSAASKADNDARETREDLPIATQAMGSLIQSDLDFVVPVESLRPLLPEPAYREPT